LILAAIDKIQLVTHPAISGTVKPPSLLLHIYLFPRNSHFTLKMEAATSSKTLTYRKTTRSASQPRRLQTECVTIFWLGWIWKCNSYQILYMKY